MIRERVLYETKTKAEAAEINVLLEEASTSPKSKASSQLER